MLQDGDVYLPSTPRRTGYADPNANANNPSTSSPFSSSPAHNHNHYLTSTSTPPRSSSGLHVPPASPHTPNSPRSIGGGSHPTFVHHVLPATPIKSDGFEEEPTTSPTPRTPKGRERKYGQSSPPQHGYGDSGRMSGEGKHKSPNRISSASATSVASGTSTSETALFSIYSMYGVSIREGSENGDAVPEMPPRRSFEVDPLDNSCKNSPPSLQVNSSDVDGTWTPPRSHRLTKDQLNSFAFPPPQVPDSSSNANSAVTAPTGSGGLLGRSTTRTKDVRFRLPSTHVHSTIVVDDGTGEHRPGSFSTAASGSPLNIEFDIPEPSDSSTLAVNRDSAVPATQGHVPNPSTATSASDYSHYSHNSNSSMPIAINSQHRTDYSSELAYFDTGVTTAVMPSPSSSLSDKEGEGMEAVKRMNGNAKPPPSSFNQPNGDDGWTTSTQARLSFQLGTTLNVPEDYGRKVNPPPQTSQPRLTLDLGDSNANSHFDPDRANPPLSQQQPLTADSNGSHSVYATPLTSVEPQPSPWARPSPTPPPPHQSHPSLSARTPSPLYTLDGAARVPSEGSQDRGDIGGTRFTPGNHSLSSNPLANGDKHQQSQGHTSGSTPAGVEGAARTEEEMMILARASYLHQNNQNQNPHHSQYMNGLPSTPRKQGTYQPPHQRRSPSPYSNGSQQSHHSQHHQQSPHQHPHQGYQHQGGVSAASAPPSAFNTPQHSRMSSRSSPVSSRSGTPVRPGANGYVAPSPVQSRSPSRSANPGHNAPAIDSRSPSRSQTPSSTLNPNMLSSPPSRPPSRVSLRQHAPSGQSSYHSQQQQKTASPAPSPIGISTSQSTSNHSREESGSTTSQTHSLDISQQSHQYSVSLAPSNQSHSNAYQHSNTSHQYPPSQYSSTSTGASQSQYQPSLSNGYYQSQAEYGGSTASGFEPRPSLLRDGSIGSRNGDKELPRTPSLLGIGANGRAGAGGSPPSSDQAQPRHSVGNRALQLHLLAVSGGATGGDRSVGGDGVGLGIRGSVTSGSGAGPDASPPPPPPPPSSMKPVSSPPRASSASASAAQTSTPRTSSSVHRHGHMSSPPGHNIRAKPSTVSLNPSLRPSLVPSAGEEPDAFHVRSTYAQLEVYGVKGDGFDEGVERTRAARTRVGSSVVTPSPNASTSLSHSPDTSATSPDSNGHQPPHRTKSQVLADEAIADENEKKRELEPEEIRVLQSVDRYGFMSVTSHERLILLPSAPLLKPLSSGAGAPSSPPSNSTSPPPLKTLQSIPPPQTNPKENDRIEKWNRMLVPHQRDEGGNVQAWRVRPSKTSKLRRRVYKGVPDRWRAAVWEVLMCAYVAGHGGDVEGGGYDGNGNPNRPWQEVDTETIVRLTASPDAASAGVRQVERSAREYREGIERPSTYDVQIDLDVPRTVSGNILFKTRYGAGQRSLFHVLHAFSLTCPVCGYVQGMGPLAATLLSYLPPSLSYTCLLRLHTSYNMHTIFSPGFPGLLEAIYVQEQLTKTYMPAVYESFKRNTIGGTSYATKWYITMFANSVPFQMQLRLWDVFWLEGMDVFVAVAVGVLWVYKDQITSPHANFETILSLLSSFFVPEDEDVFMGWIEKMLCDRKIRGSMNQWRKEWKVLVESGKEVEALL